MDKKAYKWLAYVQQGGFRVEFKGTVYAHSWREALTEASESIDMNGKITGELKQLTVTKVS